MRFLVDEDVHRQVVTLLRIAGHEVRYAAETNQGAADIDLFHLAIQENRVILTEDLGYGRIFRNNQGTNCSILTFRFTPDFPLRLRSGFIANAASAHDNWPAGVWTIQVRHRAPSVG